MSRSKRELATEFVFHLGLVSDIYSDAMRRVLRQSGFLPNRMKALMLVLDTYGGMTFARLQAKMNLQKYQVKRITDWLLKRGLVYVSVNPSDKRSRIIEASSSGRSKADDLAGRISAEIINSRMDKLYRKDTIKRVSDYLLHIRIELSKNGMLEPPRLP